MALEIERCLTIPDPAIIDAMLADNWLLSVFTAPLTVKQHNAVYYDTPDRALETLRWALRLRREDGKTVAALKTLSTHDHTRCEWQCEAVDIVSALSTLVEAGAPTQLLSMQELQPICNVVYQRTRTVIDIDGFKAELAIDGGQIESHGRHTPICELELELIDGTVNQLQDVTNAIAERYGLDVQPYSKLERAFQLRDAT